MRTARKEPHRAVLKRFITASEITSISVNSLKMPKRDYSWKKLTRFSKNWSPKLTLGRFTQSPWTKPSAEKRRNILPMSLKFQFSLRLECFGKFDNSFAKPGCHHWSKTFQDSRPAIVLKLFPITIIYLKVWDGGYSITIRTTQIVDSVERTHNIQLPRPCDYSCHV